jgi:alanyl-tRNA synthetase
MLQDTYGFPFEVAVEQATYENIELSKDYQAEFEKALEEQRERSRTASKGMFKGGLEDHGEMSTKYHTATHLLLAAIQKHISDDARQHGSNITPERMRLDFNVDHKLTDEEKKTLEDQVNEWIKADLPVSFKEMDKNYAKDVLKVKAMFWEKYPDIVKIYTIGDEDAPASREVCGGPHVEHTGVLGHFKIQKEESSSAGIRRIKAILE